MRKPQVHFFVWVCPSDKNDDYYTDVIGVVTCKYCLRRIEKAWRYKYKEPFMSQSSDARATVKHCIISGLANRAHITKVTAESADIISEDIIGALFDDATVWAVVEYAAKQKMHPTLGESAASDSESNPAPKRVI